jgi:hypothetical protein
VLFLLGVIAMPFDAIPGLPGIGELSSEGSFYLFFPALLYCALLILGGALGNRPFPGAGNRIILLAGGALLGCIAISALANAGAIGHGEFRERSALPKLVTSASVMLYGLALAWLASVCVAGRWYRGLMLPICISAAICVSYCLFEKAQLLGLGVPGFSAVNTLVHLGADAPIVLWDGSLNLKALELWDKRMRSVCFEPPAFGNFTGLIWPWLLCATLVTRDIRRRWAHGALLAAFTVVIVAAEARTGWLLLATNVLTFAGLRYVFLRQDGQVNPLAVVAIVVSVGFVGVGGLTYYLTSYDAIVREIVNGNSVSDLSRLAYQVAAFRLFEANPLFGVGFGQFAFNVSKVMPDWGFLSVEIRPSLTYPEAPWPNTYSIYARTAAEMGSLGLLAWIGMWFSLALAVYKRGLALARIEAGVPPVCVAILMSIGAILVSGLTTDTFRTPMIWITIGAAARFIAVADAKRSPRMTFVGDQPQASGMA